ncbi:hypothetical protein G9C98_006161 [Cotesia typhae]|uniref:Cyclic nucleotide-binding domain-containing protein n=1 Tax=Cotesia typhae TaxID=2053667 RepID=A0A8J5QPP8_9HYME|nr:hypothetical protein G9C98_006161 [Cotesia typhae]
MYFIVQGEVELRKIEKDYITGDMKEIHTGILGPGDMFGEVALLHSISRSTTIITKTAVDLFCLHKTDFDRLLKNILLQNWTILEDALVNFNYFKSWDDTTVRECCILSKIKDFEANEILLGDGEGMVNYVYFVLSGICRVNQWHEITDITTALMRKPSILSDQIYPEAVRTIFIQICEFHRGACFGLGEEMRNRRIVSTTPVRCLLIPRYWLLEHNHANIWQRVKVFMNSKYPTRDKLFQQFITNKKWMEYKKQLLDDVVKRTKKSCNNTTIHDVPYSIRINSTYNS